MKTSIDGTIRQLRNMPRRSALSLVMAVVGVAAIGSVLLISSHAATPALSLEAERGTVTGPATVISDSTASGGSAIQFAGPTNSGGGGGASSGMTRGHTAVGVQMHPMWGQYSDADNKAQLDKLAAAHVKWVRFDIGWASIFDQGNSPTNTSEINKMDSIINYAASKGIKVLGTWWLTPGWANGGQAPEVCPNDPSTYAASATWAAQHWAGKVQAWEVWNEPDPSQSFWQCSQQQYVQLLKAAYPAFHKGDPNTIVVLGGPASNDDAWISQIYQLGGKGSFDVLATHPYNEPSDQPPGTPDIDQWHMSHIKEVYQVEKDNGEDKPIWFTEFGWSSHPNTGGEQNWELGVTEQQQGDFFVQTIQWVNQNAPYVTNIFWYEAVNETSGGPQIMNYGLLDANLAPKLSYTILQNYLTTY